MDETTIDLNRLADLPERMVDEGDEERHYPPHFRGGTVVVQISVDQIEKGEKVNEIPFNPIKVFAPYDLPKLVEAACEQARRQWQEQGR